MKQVVRGFRDSSSTRMAVQERTADDKASRTSAWWSQEKDRDRDTWLVGQQDQMFLVGRAFGTEEVGGETTTNASSTAGGRSTERRRQSEGGKNMCYEARIAP